MGNAGIGTLVFAADDRQLRDITFWMLGSISGATWSKVGAVFPFLVIAALICPFIARGLDLLSLEEADAKYAGVSVERLKRLAIILIAASVGAAVSFCSVIGFVGIIVPHGPFGSKGIFGCGRRRLSPSQRCAVCFAAQREVYLILPLFLVTFRTSFGENASI